MKRLGVLIMILTTLAMTSVGLSSARASSYQEIGVYDTEIRIGVIADTGNPLAPGLFQGSVDAVLGWARYMNRHRGGLAGRTIVIDVYDSGLDTAVTRQAFITACARDFAIVGTSALLDATMDDILQCPDASGNAIGLPDFPVIKTEVAHQCSPVSYGINPPYLQCATRNDHPQTYIVPLGGTRYYLKKFPHLRGAFVYPSDLQAARNTEVPVFDAQRQAGIRQVVTADISARAPQSAYTPIVQAMQENRVTYARHGGNDGGMIALMKEAKLQGLNNVKVWDCEVQCYSAAILDSPDTEGLYVWTYFLPFTESAHNPMLRHFLRYTGKERADGFGAQAWATGMLLAKAIDQIGSQTLTRSNVLKSVRQISTFDAEGMIAPTNPGGRAVSECFVLNRVHAHKFVRVFPKAPGTFACSTAHVASVTLDLR